eukprot:4767948-Pleurochrysis_carterae.AAC.1
MDKYRYAHVRATARKYVLDKIVTDVDERFKWLCCGEPSSAREGSGICRPLFDVADDRQVIVTSGITRLPTLTRSLSHVYERPSREIVIF